MSTISRQSLEEENAFTHMNDPFELPKSITERLRLCVDAHLDPDSIPAKHIVKFLWIDMRGPVRDDDPRYMAENDWLNIVDEAASLGAQFIVVCVGERPGDCPGVWKLVQWAQGAHAITVGIHMNGSELSEDEIREFERLDPHLTCVFAPQAELHGLRYLEEIDIKVRSSDVSEHDHVCPCQIPQDLVCVGARGVLYSCGLVEGCEEFCLGHILEKPLEDFVKQNTAPKTTPRHISHDDQKCAACPPHMFKRIQK